jgi:hypothetical protein
VPAPAAPVQESAPIPGIEEWLGTDELYQGQLGQFGSSLSDFQAQQLGTRNSNAASFAQRLRDLQQSQSMDEEDLEEDFAGRGLLKSGVYADALADLQQQYLNSQSALQTEQTTAESDLQAALQAFQAEQTAASQQARLDAIARRAAQYGL